MPACCTGLQLSISAGNGWPHNALGAISWILNSNASENYNRGPGFYGRNAVERSVCRLQSSCRRGSSEGDGSIHPIQRDGGVADASGSRVIDIRRRRQGATTAFVGDKQLDKRVSKLLAHRAVEDKVYSVVYQRQNVEQIAETGVDLVDEAGQDAVEEVGDALRELGDEEEHDDEQQHAGGPSIGPGWSGHWPGRAGRLCPRDRAASDGAARRPSAPGPVEH